MCFEGRAVLAVARFLLLMFMWYAPFCVCFFALTASSFFFFLSPLLSPYNHNLLQEEKKKQDNCN